MNNKKRVFRIFLLASFIASETLLIDVKSDAMKKGNIIKQIHNINDTTILDYERFKWYGKIDSESEQSSFVDAKKLLKERYGCENFYCYQHAPFFLLVGLDRYFYVFYPLNEKKISEEEAKNIQNNIKANLSSINFSILPKRDSILRLNLFARKNIKIGKKMLRIPIIDQTRKMPIFEDDLDDSFSFELIDGSDNESITMSTSTIKKNGSNDELSTMSTSTVKRNSDKDQSKQAINWQSPPRLLLKLENGKLNISLDINSNINQDDTYKTPLNNGKDSPENTVRRQPKKFLRKNKKNLTLEI